MVSARISPFIWKWAVSLLAVCIGVMLQAELRVGHERLEQKQGSLGITLVDQTGVRMEGLGTHWLRVAQVDQSRDAYTKGVRAGDRLRFDRPLDRWRRFAPDEQVGLSVEGRGHKILKAVPENVPTPERDDYVGRAWIALPALFFAVLIAWYQPVLRAYRSLAAMFLCTGMAFYSSFIFSAPESLGAYGRFLQPALKCLLWYCAADFALHYGAHHAGPLRKRLASAARLYRPLALAAAACSLAFAFGAEISLLWLLVFATIAGGCLLLLLSLLDGWYLSRGELRQRYRWLLAAVGIGAIPALVLNLPWPYSEPRPGGSTIIVYFVTQAVMYGLLTYAVLRHRVFDFYLAVSRTLVFSILSAIMLLVFHRGSEFLTHHVFKAEADASWHPLFDALPAIVIFLSFDKMHAWAEHSVQALVFRRWVARERGLREWMAKIAQASASVDLLDSLTVAFDRYSGGAGTAVYLCDSDNRGVRVASSLDGVPDSLSPDDPLLVILRADLAPSCDSLPQDPGGLALPMCHRGLLHGLVLLGPRGDGNCYRSDEILLLNDAASRAGLALHALRVEELQGALSHLEELTRRAAEELRAFAGRRHIEGIQP